MKKAEQQQLKLSSVYLVQKGRHQHRPADHELLVNGQRPRVLGELVKERPNDRLPFGGRVEEERVEVVQVGVPKVERALRRRRHLRVAVLHPDARVLVHLAGNVIVVPAEGVEGAQLNGEVQNSTVS